METEGLLVVAVTIVVTLYMIIHILYNRLRGRDELDGLFDFQRIIRNKKRN